MNPQGAVKPQRGNAKNAPPAKPYTIDESGAVRIPRTEIKSNAPVIAKRYLAGTTLDCPVQTVHVRGVAFQRFSGGSPHFTETGVKGRPRHVNDARKVGAERWGGYVDLTDAQLEKVAEDVGLKVMRVTDYEDGGRPKQLGEVKSTLAPSYKHAGNDRPLGEYLYLVPASDLRGDQMESGDFPPMIPREE